MWFFRPGSMSLYHGVWQLVPYASLMRFFSKLSYVGHPPALSSLGFSAHHVQVCGSCPDTRHQDSCSDSHPGSQLPMAQPSHWEDQAGEGPGSRRCCNQSVPLPKAQVQNPNNCPFRFVASQGPCAHFLSTPRLSYYL